jgi:hypothetical protein
MSHPARQSPGTSSPDRLRRGAGALAAGVGALVVLGDGGALH